MAPSRASTIPVAHNTGLRCFQVGYSAAAVVNSPQRRGSLAVEPSTMVLHTGAHGTEPGNEDDAS